MKFICDFEGCPKKFVNITLLRTHKKSHTGQRDYACKLCDKKYFSSSRLRDHVSIIHEKQTYNCEICSSKLSRKDTFLQHMLMQHRDIPQVEKQYLIQKIKPSKPN